MNYFRLFFCVRRSPQRQKLHAEPKTTERNKITLSFFVSIREGLLTTGVIDQVHVESARGCLRGSCTVQTIHFDCIELWGNTTSIYISMYIQLHDASAEFFSSSSGWTWQTPSHEQKTHSTTSCSQARLLQRLIVTKWALFLAFSGHAPECAAAPLTAFFICSPTCWSEEAGREMSICFLQKLWRCSAGLLSTRALFWATPFYSTDAFILFFSPG